MEKSAPSFDQIEEDLCTAVVIVEKELGMYIDDQYPLMKFYVQLDEIRKYKEREQQEMERANRKR